MNTSARVACIFIIVTLTIYYIYCWIFGEALGNAVYTWQVPWGIYVWLDVYYGFILMATLIYAYERHLGLTLLIFFIMCWTGNMIAAAWLLWRAPDIYDRIAHPRTPA